MSYDDEDVYDIVGNNGKKSRNVRGSSKRASKIARGDERKMNPKFVEDDSVCVPDKGMEFKPRTENQKRFLRYMREGRKLIWGVGVVGSGKSICSAYHAAQLLKERKIEKVYLLRPNVSCGKSHGAVPGDLHQKLMVLFGQTISHFEKFLGKGFTKYCLDKKVIELLSIEYLFIS